jgi:hypothetical protein
MDTSSVERRASPLGLGPRGLLPNLYDLIVFVIIAAVFVALAHGARQMSASMILRPPRFGRAFSDHGKLLLDDTSGSMLGLCPLCSLRANRPAELI